MNHSRFRLVLNGISDVTTNTLIKLDPRPKLSACGIRKLLPEQYNCKPPSDEQLSWQSYMSREIGIAILVMYVLLLLVAIYFCFRHERRANQSSVPEEDNLHSISTKTPEDVAIDTPDSADKALYFWSIKGRSFMGFTSFFKFPILMPDANSDAKCRIVWKDKSDSKVAIVCSCKGKTYYLSCNNKRVPFTNSSLAGFSKQVRESETFIMSYCKDDNSFFFLSHNNLVLHYNETFHSIEFKTCSERDKYGMPTKGRWSLLWEKEANRVGTKNGMTQIMYHLLAGPVVVSLKVLKEVKDVIQSMG